jgi:hypothetical protein
VREHLSTATLVGWVTILVGAALIFRTLHAVLADRLLSVVVAIVAVAVVINVAVLILWRRRPDLLARVRARMQAESTASVRPYGPPARLFFGVVGVFCLAVTVLGGLFMWQAPDFALFALLWVGPAAYLAVTTLYLAATGRKDADASAFWFLLWPW